MRRPSAFICGAPGGRPAAPGSRLCRRAPNPKTPWRRLPGRRGGRPVPGNNQIPHRRLLAKARTSSPVDLKRRQNQGGIPPGFAPVNMRKPPASGGGAHRGAAPCGAGVARKAERRTRKRPGRRLPGRRGGRPVPGNNQNPQHRSPTRVKTASPIDLKRRQNQGGIPPGFAPVNMRKPPASGGAPRGAAPCGAGVARKDER